jgi:hypothetical protein
MDDPESDDLAELDALWKRLADGMQVRVDGGEIVVYGPLARMQPEEVARALDAAGDHIRSLVAQVRALRKR